MAVKAPSPNHWTSGNSQELCLHQAVLLSTYLCAKDPCRKVLVLSRSVPSDKCLFQCPKLQLAFPCLWAQGLQLNSLKKDVGRYPRSAHRLPRTRQNSGEVAPGLGVQTVRRGIVLSSKMLLHLSASVSSCVRWEYVPAFVI